MVWAFEFLKSRLLSTNILTFFKSEEKVQCERHVADNVVNFSQEWLNSGAISPENHSKVSSLLVSQDIDTISYEQGGAEIMISTPMVNIDYYYYYFLLRKKGKLHLRRSQWRICMICTLNLTEYLNCNFLFIKIMVSSKGDTSPSTPSAQRDQVIIAQNILIATVSYCTTQQIILFLTNLKSYLSICVYVEVLV